jgi:serine O-acetyltransferase
VLISLGRDGLHRYVSMQLEHNFPDGSKGEVGKVVDGALERLEHCFKWIALPGYNRGEQASFNHLHGDQTAVFYYLAANTAYRAGDVTLAQKFFLLNKAMNGIVCMYDTELPPVFAFIHTTGTMVGKAHYGNFVALFQGVTVGADRGELPVIGERCIIYGGSIVVGGSRLGDGVVVAGNSAIIHQEVPANSIAAGRSPDLDIAPRKRDVAAQYFRLETAAALDGGV